MVTRLDKAITNMQHPPFQLKLEDVFINYYQTDLIKHIVVKRLSSYQLMFVNINLKTILCSVISLMVCTQFLTKKLTIKSDKYNPQ